MIFWTLIALTVIITTSVVVRERNDRWGTPIGSGIFSLVVCTIVGAIIFVICVVSIPSIENTLARNDTYQLKALGTSSTIQGRFYFLGGGYINNKRVLNFITDQGGAIRLSQSDADQSTIYENATQPTVTIRNYDQHNGWVLPWTLPTHDEYEFHVPAGSVESDYQVSNK